MLRGYTARLSKKEKLCTKFYSSSHLQQRTIPNIIHHNHNIRFIQSTLINHHRFTQKNTSPFISSYHNKKSILNHQNNNNNTSHYLQYTNQRSFSLPDHEIIGLPALSPSVEVSKVVTWKKNEGDLVEADEAIASVQTDKAELDWQVTDDVYLAKILLQPGQEVPVGTPACIFVEEQKDVAAFKDYTPGAEQASTPSTPTPTPSADTTASTPSPPSTPPPAAAPAGNYPEHNVEGMPALSPTAVDGAIVEWLVKEGDMVEEGTGIAEIQTDKSVVTWTSTDEAYVAKLLVPASPDNKLPVGTPLAVFVDESKDVAAFKDYVAGAAPASGTPPPDAPSQPAPAKESTQAAPAPPAGRQPSIQFRYGVRDTPQTVAKSTKAGEGGRVFASPYAKKLAAEMGITLDAVGTATGHKGRIVAADVIKASQEKPAAAKEDKKEKVATPIPVSFVSGDRTYEDIPVSVMRDIIGKRLSESKFTSPHFYVTMECTMDSLMKMRSEINTGEENKISVNDFVIKSCARALRDTPDCNVGWIVDKATGKAVIRKYNYVDISVAVATPAGLITPIIKDADIKSLTQISLEMKDLAKRAKANKLLPDEFQGGTFTISNMGMFGVNNFTAIINPPQSCILAVGGAKKKLFPDETEKGFKNVTTMEVTLSSDHRSVDGALAALWVNSFQKYIQGPSKLML